ncbi:MAG: GNAT family N-acetyltransferase [Rhizobiales bacterium 65-9]|nr:GNAT family N-acetyltransferase [Hyphomicrobiales bacterium]OJY36623.1 MAG: GNAT family N-acetyltransferase [Rhizobiales bacterium 65-9]
MSTLTLTIRPARPADAAAITAVHDAAWREAYRGVIPGAHLERMVQRRGPLWWKRAITRGSLVLVLDTGDRIAGYASMGRNRAAAVRAEGEIFELYLDPIHQGLGFGSRLFGAAKSELAERGLAGLVVWALADNDRACAFYGRRGGRIAARALEHFGTDLRERVAYVWP